MESNVGAPSPSPSLTPSKPKPTGKSKLPENINPNITSPNLKTSNSPAVKSAIKSQKSDKICSPSPKNKIRERKFVVAKKNTKRDKSKSVAYETLRASQEGFFKSQIEVKEIETGNPNLPEGKSEEGDVNESSGEKRPRERASIPEPGSGRVMDLVKAFENILILPKETDNDEKEKEEKPESKWEFSPDILLTAENLGLCSRVSSSLDSNRDGNRGSIGNRTSNGRSRRNSSESASTFGGSRWKRRTNRATSQQPFKLRTEQRGRSKQEEFMKKVQEMMIEQEKQRIPIAQGLPFTTDEPECLVKPPVKERTKPVDLVLHSDVRAVERAEFDNQVQEKLSFIEQYRLERERLQKLEEEEELRRLRKELVPKAQPMPYFDRPFIPRRSEKQPKEPKFHNHPQHKKIKCCGSMSSWSDMCAQSQ